MIDVFELEYVSSPQISPDGTEIIYVRNFKDIMTDKNLSNLWIIRPDGTKNRPLTTGNQSDFAPLWSPDGKKILYKSNVDGSVQLYLRWMDDGSVTKLTNLTRSPGQASWSPDGQWIAFTMFVHKDKKPFVTLPRKPRGAKWNDPPKYIDELHYRADGAGYLRDGYTQIFILPADGGTPRQITNDPYDHRGPLSWSTGGKFLYFSANGHEEGEYEPRNTEIYRLDINSGEQLTLTNRKGPDNHPVISPDGKKIAYLGYDDHYLGYQIVNLYVMHADGTHPKLITGKLDRDVANIHWDNKGKGLYFQYDDHGNTKIAYVSLSGNITDLAKDVGGLSLGRPYSAGTFSVSNDGRLAYTCSTPQHPADLATATDWNNFVRLTRLNDDLFSYKHLGTIEEIRYKSSFDGKEIQGWICKPAGFNPEKKYPLILEIHGGPYANYGNRFSAEIQLYLAAGYVVLYVNPRGSTGYGAAFGNLIHHNYPGQDFDDLMSGVDAVIAKGYIDKSNLFVTGGSGGGALTAWIVGHTDRFNAAVSVKPVINWYSFILYADLPVFFYKYWMPGLPWDHLEHYMKRSPIQYAGNVKTPTMVMTGESDFRTPIPEAEQFYMALKLRKVDTALVRIPGASHGIAARPSNLIAKVAYILKWFEKYRVSK